MKVKGEIKELNSRKPHEQIEILINLSKSLVDLDISELENAIDSSDSPFVKNSLISLLERKTSSIKMSAQRQNADETFLDVKAIKSEAYSESIGQLLHELNPIIGAIKLHTKNEIQDFHKSETFKDLIDLEEVIVTFEDWLKVEQTAKFRSLGIYDAINRVVGILQKQHNIPIIVNLSESLEIITDQSLFRIIISNVLRNSIQATDEKNYCSSPIIITGGLTNREFWLSIIDNGCGLKESKETMARSRFSTKPGNQGLGLTILEKAVFALGGSWELKNGAVRGSEFHLELPLREL